MIISALPLDTYVPVQTILIRSAKAVFSDRLLVFLLIGYVSQVNILSMVLKLERDIILPSATILSPSLSIIMSHGTTFFESIVMISLFLFTLAVCTTIVFKALISLCALISCIAHTTALIAKTTMMTVPSTFLPNTKDTILITIRIYTSILLNWLIKIIIHELFLLIGKVFSQYVDIL
jgi:hypothetical protein